jgi:hypothetical protein
VEDATEVSVDDGSDVADVAADDVSGCDGSAAESPSEEHAAIRSAAAATPTVSARSRERRRGWWLVIVASCLWCGAIGK